MGFLDNLKGSFGTGALASGAGSLLGGIAGIAGIRQSKKNAKLQRELARKNFELQKEYAEKNYQLQVSQQQMQADQFQTMVDLSNPSNQRAALEQAGFNPFMDGSAIGTPNTPGSSAGSIGSVAAPQIDGSGMMQAASLQQQSINNAVGNLNGLLEAAEKIATLPTDVSKGKAEKNLLDIQNRIANEEHKIKIAERIGKELELPFIEENLRADLNTKLANILNINEQTGLFKKQGQKIDVDIKVANETIKKIQEECKKLIEETTGQKLDNQYQEVVNKYARQMFDTQIAEARSRINKNNADAKLATNESIRTLTPQNIGEFHYFNHLGNDYPLGTYNYLNEQNNTSLDYHDAQIYSLFANAYANNLNAATNSNMIGLPFGIKFAPRWSVDSDRKAYNKLPFWIKANRRPK